MATVAMARRRRLGAERVFFSTMALAMIGSIVVGFAPCYYLRGVVPPAVPLLPLSPLVHLHAVLFSGWALLFVVQTLLVAGGRSDLHRRLGMIGLPLLLAMILVATFTALDGVPRHSAPPGVPPLVWLAVPLLDIPVFASLIGLALAWRRDAASHKRLMLIAMTGMMGPALGRVPLLQASLPGPMLIFGIPDLFILPLILWDLRTLGRVHRSTLLGLLIVLGSQIFRLLAMGSPLWLAFAGWLVALTS